MLRIMGAAALIAAAVGTVATAPAHAGAVKNLKHCDGVMHGVYKNVTVQAGDSCTLAADATVLGNVHAKKGAKNLIVHTEVAHNIQAMGVTGLVMVGPKGCGYDPRVGNNVHVSKSHNVLICQVSADNNIMVSTSDGRITVRDSSAVHNVKVNRNLAYVSDGHDTDHANPGTIRLINVTGHHVTTKHNDPSRKIIRRNVIEG